MQPGATVNGQSIGKLWNTITQSEMASRLRARGFCVLTPSITQYGEDSGISGIRALHCWRAQGQQERSNCATHRRRTHCNPQNPIPGAQMLVTGTNPRDPVWEALIQSHLDPFYKAEGLGTSVHVLEAAYPIKRAHRPHGIRLSNVPPNTTASGDY